MFDFNAINLLSARMNFTGFQCIDDSASIIIGPNDNNITLTNNGIQCLNTEFTLDAPILNITQDQKWGGIIYAKDGTNILIDPKNRTSVFSSASIKSNNAELKQIATPNHLNTIYNSNTNIITMNSDITNHHIFSLDRTLDVNASNSHTWNIISPNMEWTFSCSNDFKSTKNYPVNNFEDVIKIGLKTYKLQEKKIKLANGTDADALLYILI